MLIIVTPNSNRDLTRLATIKAELGVTDRKSDDVLNRYITQVSDVVAKHCNRVFAIETVTETFRGSHMSCTLQLGRFPVTEVISVNENGTALASSDYEIDAENGIVERLYSDRITNWSAGKTVITYKAGYALPDGLPDGIERATIMLVKLFVSSKNRDPMIRSEEVHGLGSVDYTTSNVMPSDVTDILVPHRKSAGC